MGRKKIRLLFLCTGNSCRSQMVEGWANHLIGDIVEASSAGIEAHGLNPLAVKVMAESGIDISRHVSTRADGIKGDQFAFFITACSDADENCPVFPR